MKTSSGILTRYTKHGRTIDHARMHPEKTAKALARNRSSLLAIPKIEFL